jgi:hypothetical protein
VRRVIPLLLALLAAVPQAAFAGKWYRCRYTGETRDACCCPQKKQAEPPAQAQVTRAECCDVLRRDPHVVSARSDAGRELRAALVLPALAPAALHAPTSSGDLVQAPAERATAPPRILQPLYLRHSSLLL